MHGRRSLGLSLREMRPISIHQSRRLSIGGIEIRQHSPPPSLWASPRVGRTSRTRAAQSSSLSPPPLRFLFFLDFFGGGGGGSSGASYRSLHVWGHASFM
eukprot:CAMPEP_0183350114 /NCGR_PEP_ID=MMETSP0164_2-20130417/16773_1 /TAXON_ID=221442 /ORGANISM="Coccolithus pelagicus ssp braarudi, Strain PLY182g" /LENGTH=99 /DNA_ID=CAMNT_0025521983 /DNA_START=853 /DNA_END=1152 /DNA_ORIENTATION=+